MNIHCSGIGGIGLSAYASLQALSGHTVSGSDRARSGLTETLQAAGIPVTTDQSGDAIPAVCDLLVYSEAIPASAPERQCAEERGIPQQSYPAAVGELTRGYRLICVCGTHGKSSTTAMAARLMTEAGMDPTVIVGTKVRELGGRNWRKGGSSWFLLEACEYRRSFLHYDPSIILLTTCDGDHFDYYRDDADYRSAFVEFTRKLPDDGLLITHFADPACRSVAEASGRRTIDADVFPLIELRTPGLHMRQNAQLVLALASVVGIDARRAEEIVAGYEGSWRRIETRGTYRGSVTVIDDYAHHPREVAATIQAVRDAHPDRRLVCVFQPHTHNRTIALRDGFAHAFAGADVLLLTDVYDARTDTERERADVPALANAIAEGSCVPAQAAGSLADAERVLRGDVIHEGDVLLCMGAGDITDLATSLVSAEPARAGTSR